jgi:hypothetical protein
MFSEGTGSGHFPLTVPSGRVRGPKFQRLRYDKLIARSEGRAVASGCFDLKRFFARREVAV